MDYTSINSFLDKFKKLIFQKEELKNIVIGVIKEETSFEFNINSIKIKDGFICIKASPLVRSEILIHKERILNKLKSLNLDYNFLDIK